MEKNPTNLVKLEGEVINIPTFKKQCRNIETEKLSFTVKCPTPTEHYALIPISLWGSLAVDFRDRIIKGTTLTIEGSLGTWSWKNSTTSETTKQFAVNANHINILSRKKKEDA